MLQGEFHQLVLTTRTELEWLEGRQAIAAEEQPHEPTGGSHLSWMLARSIQLWAAGKEQQAMRWLGHVEGLLLAKRRAEAPSSSQGGAARDGRAFTEQEKRVWASTLGACLAAKELNHIALGRAYEAAWLVREQSRLQGFDGFSFPKDWELPER